MAGINVQDQFVSDLVEMTGYGVLHWPLSYFVPLWGDPLAKLLWDLVLQRISKGLRELERACFSLDGRITLLQASLFSVPLYYLC